jgi:hypothetical protein
VSFEIDAENVERVLLPDGWHSVSAGSLEIDAYEVMLGDERLAREAQGFTFVARRLWRRVRVSGPLSAVLALEERASGDAGEEPLDDGDNDEQGFGEFEG